MNASAELLPETSVKRHADLLEKAGFSREEALRMSLHEEGVHATASAGAVYEITVQQIGGVWQRACRAGARSVLLDVRAQSRSPEEYDRHVTVTVLEHEPWADLDPMLSTRPVLEATRDRTATPEQRRDALGRISARRSELLRELADLNDMTAGHEEDLARGSSS